MNTSFNRSSDDSVSKAATLLTATALITSVVAISPLAAADTRTASFSDGRDTHTSPTRGGIDGFESRRLLELDSVEPSENGYGLLEPAAARSADEAPHWRLNLDLDFSSAHNKPLVIDRIEFSYPDVGAPASKTVSGYDLLTSTDGKKSHLFTGGWNRFGAYAGQLNDRNGYFNDIAYRNEAGVGHRSIAVGTQFAPGPEWLVARLNSDGTHIRNTTLFAEYDAATAKAVSRSSTSTTVAGWVSDNGVKRVAVASFDATSLELRETYGEDNIGYQLYDIDGADIQDVIEILPYPGGHIVLVAVERNGIKEMNVLRLGGDGNLISYFGDDGVLRISFPFNINVEAADMATNAGNIYVAATLGNGCSDNVPGGCHMAALRFDQNGDWDMSYGNVGAWRTIDFPDANRLGATAITVNASGEVWLGGWVQTNASSDSSHWAITKLRGNGEVATEWAFDGNINDLCAEPPCGSGQQLFQFNQRPGGVADLALGSAGQLIAGGWVKRANGMRDFAVGQFDTAGMAEWGSTAFSQYSEYQDWAIIKAIAVDDLDRVMVVGDAHMDSDTGNTGDHFASARFRADGVLDSRLALDPGDARELKLPEGREFDVAASQVNINVHFRGIAASHAFSVPLLSHNNQLSQGGYLFPLDGLAKNEYWSTGQHHALHTNHRNSRSQRFAYDLGLNHVDPKTGVARSTHLDDNQQALPKDANENYLIWGKTVRAAASGRVLVCYRTLDDNPAPGSENKLWDVINISGGGNMFWIEHTNGEVALYAHFQKDSVPAELCPTDGIQAAGAWVNKGDKLGVVGNSGNSTGPHLHFHVQRGLDSFAEAVEATFNADNEGLPSLFGQAQVLRKADLKAGLTDFAQTWQQAVPFDSYVQDHEHATGAFGFKAQR